MPAAAQDLQFSPKALEACIAAKSDTLDQGDCIGVSANACMVTDDGGMTTVGMGYCLEQEWLYWDTRLNGAYKEAMTAASQMDADNIADGIRAPRQAHALRDMQRAWISFRDAKCTHASSLWGGGTGAGPAAISCMMVTTGEQVLYLEQMALGK